MEMLKINSWPVTVLVFVAVLLTISVLFYYKTAILQFLSQVKVELSKCTWPWNPELTGLKRYKELIDSTVIVSVTSILLAAYVSSFDFFINRFVSWLVKF